MNSFKVVEILDEKTIIVEPKWHYASSKGAEYEGNKITIRDLAHADIPQNKLEEVKSRLTNLLKKTNSEIIFDSPEPTEYSDPKNATVSCSVYLANTSISYYFPEYVRIDKD